LFADYLIDPIWIQTRLKMADDALFDFLHMEIVSHATKSDPSCLQDGVNFLIHLLIEI
jgi:hypothetical protein